MLMPDWALNKNSGPTYDDIVASWGYNTLDTFKSESHQGDKIYLLKDFQGRIGLVVIGYGSCSACDELEAAKAEDDWRSIEMLSIKYRQSIHWENSKEELMHWCGLRYGKDWWAHDEKIQEWLIGHRAQLF